MADRIKDVRDIRTDLAKEVYEHVNSKDGVSVQEEAYFGDITVSHISITNEQGARSLGRPVGSYITIEAPSLSDSDDEYDEKVSSALSAQLKKLLGNQDKNRSILVVGLGNPAITADSLGPKVASHIRVTRHIKVHFPDMLEKSAPNVCMLSPSVLGITGIETLEVVSGVAEKVKPQAIIVIDSLASRSTERISTTIQLCDTGIFPGSGLGNHRMELSKNTLGVPVIALGVPTVVYASTISQDAVSLLLEQMGQSEEEGQKLVDLVGKLVNEKIGPLVVTPKEIDRIVLHCANVIAKGIDGAL